MLASILKNAWILPLSMLSCSVFAENSHLVFTNGTVSGNVGLVSKYIYRGGVENDGMAIQGGLEYADKNGISLGYWGATLDYDATDENHDHGFEHNLYVSYSQQIKQDWSYSLQTTAYIYQNGGTIYGNQQDSRRTTAFDFLAGITYKDLNLNTSIMLADVSFANAGDIYISADYSYTLISDFIFKASIGGSCYNRSHDDSLIQTKKQFAFNEAKIGVSKTIANIGLIASFDYVIGGKNRFAEDFDDQAVFGLNYKF